MNSKQAPHSSLSPTCLTIQRTLQSVHAKKDLTSNQVIGIIGGMGPEATVNLFSKIIEKSKPFIQVDQDHIRIIIDNNPKIPDRTKFIQGKGKNPISAIIKTAQTLEKAGVTLGVIPCMTSHYFYDDIQNSVSYPIINAYIETYNYIISNFPNVQKIGVLATTGTRSTKLFEKHFANKKIIFPSLLTQENKVMEAIYGQKGIKKGLLSNENTSLLIDASHELIKNGAEIIIAGCTEIPLVLKKGMLAVPIVDPMEIVTKTIIRKVYLKTDSK